MGNIITQDEHLASYIHAKQEDPNRKIVLRQFQKKYVDAVDYLVRISHGERDTVETSEDWMIVSKIFEVWSRLYPQEWTDYVKSMQDIRSSRARKDGFSKEKGISGVRYSAALPPRVEKMISVIFKHQKWNREFISKLTNNIKISRVGDKIDTWFTIPDAPKIRKDIVEETVKKVKGDSKTMI